ncbi:MAG: hypothetical protein K2X39_01290, partial [Silvanigrellaceae bacterium]|nr:hypothetical protein [Silvanigrellaceae bacterium]
ERDAAQSLRIMQLEQQLAAVQVTHGKQLAVSQALLDLEEQKKMKSFVPCILRSINLKDAVKSMISVGPHFLVCLLGKKEDYHGGSSLAIIDLRQTSDKCLLKIIDLDARNSNLRRFSFAPVGHDHFIYCFEVEKNQQDKQDLSEIILWNIANLQQESSFQVPYKGVNIIEVLTAKRVLISGTKNYKGACAILELKTGKVQPHPHLEIVDFNGWHDRIVAPTYFPGQVELAYLVYESERNRTTTPKELRLYNCETFQNTVITSENIKDFEASSSKPIFKFISPTLIAISNRSQYENRGNIHLRLLNTETKLYTQTFSPPELKTSSGWGNTPSYQGFFDACLLPDDVLVAICDDPESKNASESRLLMWNLKTAQLTYNISVQGNARRLHYDEERDVLYCSNNNQIQVYQVKPTSMKSLPKPASSTHHADDRQTFTSFNSK